MRIFCRRTAGSSMLLLMAFTWPFLLLARQYRQQPGNAKDLAPVSHTYAVTHATVVPAPGHKLEGATVVIKDGLIIAVGKEVSVPSDAIIIHGDSLYIYAGFIDGLSHAGINRSKEDGGKPRERPKDPGNPTPEQAGITPQYDVRSFLNPAEKSIDELRALGFTAAQVVPYGNMLPGSSAIILLSGNPIDQMVMVNKSSLFSQLKGAQRVYPSTVMAVMAKWRELYRQAIQIKNYESIYKASPTGLVRPATDPILQSFYPVIDKKIPVLFEGDKYLDIQRVLTLQSDLGFSLMLGNIKQGWDAIEKIKSSGAKVFLSLDLPKEKKEDAKKNDRNKDKKDENLSAFSPGEKEALEKRKAEFMALYTGQAAAFQKAGVTFGFSSFSASPADIRANLRRMIKAGLTEDQALAALTTAPAELLGLSDRMGTISNGKIANLVLTDKPCFDEKAQVRYVFVDGIVFKYDRKEMPKTGSMTKPEIEGIWSVVSESSQGKTEETITFQKEGDDYTGSRIAGSSQQAQALEEVELNGNILKYRYTEESGGESLRVDVEVTVEGNTFKGTAKAGAEGSFSVEGKKNPDQLN